jgi:hypothetical protein
MPLSEIQKRFRKASDTIVSDGKPKKKSKLELLQEEHDALKLKITDLKVKVHEHSLTVSRMHCDLEDMKDQLQYCMDSIELMRQRDPDSFDRFLERLGIDKDKLLKN